MRALTYKQRKPRMLASFESYTKKQHTHTKKKRHQEHVGYSSLENTFSMTKGTEEKQK